MRIVNIICFGTGHRMEQIVLWESDADEHSDCPALYLSCLHNCQQRAESQGQLCVAMCIDRTVYENQNHEHQGVWSGT